MPRSLISRFVFAGVALSIAIAALYLFALAKSGTSFFGVRGGLPFVRNFRVWVVDSEGKIDFQTHAEPLPKEWHDIPRGELGVAHFTLLANHSDRMGTLPLLGNSERVVVFKIPSLLSFAFATQSLSLVLDFLGHALVISALTGSMLLLVLIAYHRRLSRVAKLILGRLKDGELQVRFPISRLDETGQLMVQFNAMADQIETLFRNLKIAETARSNLLRELSHDIRTPLTAIRGIVETVRDCADRLSVEEIRSQMESAAEEVRYFQRLIDDLFLLAQCEEPQLQSEEVNVDLAALLRVEAESVLGVARRQGKEVALNVKVPDTSAVVFADTHLIRRVLRNSLENAFQYCQSQVNALLSRKEEDGFLELTVRDDGPGLSPDAIHSFGVRRAQRFMDHTAAKKISLGLGSVILKKIISKYQGEISVSNWHTADGKIGGAELRIRLPLALRSKT